MNVRQVVSKDAIPSVDEPTFGDTYDADADDRVLVYQPPDSEPRAYPLRFLNYHEIVNDVAGRPIAVTWCPLCGSAVVYDRRLPAGDLAVEGNDVLSFGVSGKLADDDLVMYDRRTGSEWKQSLGECIAGPLEGAALTVLPAAVLEYTTFREEYDGVVLQPPGGESEAAGEGDDPEPIDYDAGPYRDYETGEGFGLAAHRGTGSREWDRDDVDPKTVVLGIERGGEALGVPLPAVRAAGGVLEVTVGGTDVVVFGTDGLVAFEHPGPEFEVVDGDPYADGTTWNGATGEAADGRRLDSVPAKRLYAFAWQDDHGPGALLAPAGVTVPPAFAAVVRFYHTSVCTRRTWRFAKQRRLTVRRYGLSHCVRWRRRTP